MGTLLIKSCPVSFIYIRSPSLLLHETSSLPLPTAHSSAPRYLPKHTIITINKIKELALLILNVQNLIFFQGSVFLCKKRVDVGLILILVYSVKNWFSLIFLGIDKVFLRISFCFVSFFLRGEVDLDISSWLKGS